MALALLAVTAALAVLLAVQYHLTGPTVAVAILGTVPALAGLYLAWAALPGAIGPLEPGVVNKPAFGRLAGQWVPKDLGVHQVIDHGSMPAYVRRPHDDLLRAVLDPAVAASRLVVLRGGSSTGKSRAAYEAVVGGLAAGLPAERSRARRTAGRCCGWVSCASTPTMPVARRSWAVWLTCS